MAATPAGVILRHLRQLVATPHTRSLGDRQLLERFTRHHDEAAFEALMERHGAMVLGVCRRVLHDDHAAEDVFQATFLVLARDAGAIRRPESVGSWLFGVAYRLARRARMDAAKRHRYERRPRPMPAAEDPTAGLTWREVQQILDDELHRLPERFRIPLVLCYLEGKTQAEAAAQLGWSKGTLRRRLEQGQALLRRRLLRRDPTLATNHLAVVLAAPLAAPALPAALILSTTRAAMRFAAGPSAAQEAIAPHVIALTEGVWPTLWAAKLKIVAAALLLTAGLATAGMGLVGWPVTTAIDSAGGAPETSAADQPAKDEQGPRTDRHGDALPPGALLRLGTVRFREKEEMAGIAFVPAGKVLATGCSDGLLRLWDPATGKSVGQMKGQEDGLPGFAISPDGKLLATNGEKAVYLWDVATSKELHKIPYEVTLRTKEEVSRGLRVAPIVFSPDGRLLTSVAPDHAVYVWEVAAGKERLRLGPLAEEVDCLAFTPDGKRLISAIGGRVKDGKVYFWETATGKEIRQIPIPARVKYPTTRPFDISPDGNTLAVEGLEPITGKNANGVMTVSMGSQIRLIDLARGEERLRLARQPSVIWSAVFAPDSKTIALATMDQTITVWDTATGKQRHRFQGYPGGMSPQGMQTLAFAPDGRTLASVESGTAIHLWDLTTGRELPHESESHDSAITRVVYSRDGRTIASAGRDHSICLWDAVTGRLRIKLKGHTKAVGGLAFSPDGTTLASWGEDATVRLWNVATGKELHRFMAPPLAIGNGLYAPVSLGMAFTADGKMLAVAGGDLKFRLLDVATGKELRQCPIHVTPSPRKLADYDHSSWTYHVELSPDGQTVVLWNLDTIYLVDTATGQELLRLSTDGNPEELAFSPDGQTLVTAGWFTTGRSLIWELATGKVAREVGVGRFHWINSVAFSPDGRRVALAEGWRDGKIHLLDVATGKERRTFQGHGGCVPTLVFSPNGTRLASGQRDSTVLVWDATPPVQHKGVPAAKLTPQDLNRLWTALADVDASKAWTARWTLIDRPDQAVPFLKNHLTPAAGKESRRLEQLFADLDHEDFARREAASKELAQRGAAIRPALRYALERANSAEARTRLQALLAQPMNSWTPSAETLRRLRAIQVLEQIGSPEAGLVLANLARGSWTAPETQNARAAGDRLARRSQTRR